MTSPTELLDLRDQLDRVGAKQPNWMHAVLATSIGPKISDGRATSTPAIQFVVREKLPKKQLTRSDIVPRQIDGIRTDVLRLSGELSMTDASAPAAAVRAGYGAGFVTQSGDVGTIGCCAISAEVGAVYLTAGHVIAPREIAYLLGETRPPCGTCIGSRAQASGAELYGDRARNPDEPFAVDLALIASRGMSLPIGGLPGGHPFLVFADSIAVAQNLGSADVLAIGGASHLLHRGVVAGIWPRPAGVGLTGFCVIQHSPEMIPGNSGAMWLARSAQGWVALGLHRSLVAGASTPYSFVTDLAAGARLAGISAFLTIPDGTVGGAMDGGPNFAIAN